MNMQQFIDHQERFTRCWILAQPAVASYISAVVPDFHEAQDLLQNVAVVCLRKFSEFDDKRPFVAWALGVAKIELLRLRRARARAPLVNDDTILQMLAAACEEVEPQLQAREWALSECIRELRGRAEELIRLRYDETLKPAAIAGRLGMNAVAVRVALNRVRATLRECIEQKLQSIVREV